MSTATATIARPQDAEQTMAAVRPARFEMGVRNVRTDGTTVSFQVGMGASTCWVDVTVNGWDYYDVVIYKARAGQRSTVGEISNVPAENMARAMIAEWCTICARKGW